MTPRHENATAPQIAGAARRLRIAAKYGGARGRGALGERECSYLANDGEPVWRVRGPRRLRA